ncbi:hypothetical protein AB0K09_11000 [Streptomyces sp. NPDC049577]|uniref:hypothetical protein n=1 Tax=Streptomyces sp. NPDC049577 TaxID=3155153 RepID=UPI003437FD0E
MRRGVVHALAWVLATGAAMAVSWYGVRTVLTGTGHEPPRALPLSRAAVPSPAASVSATSGVRSPVPAPSSPPPSSSAPSGRPGAPGPSPSGSRPSPGGDGVRSFPVTGGRVVFDLGEGAATLVSATPDEGWEMRVWTQVQWIRVDFVSGARTSSVFVTWNGHPPRVQTVES